MRFAVAAAALLGLVVGCGGGATAETSAAGDALAYLPADASTVILLSTDVDGAQWEAVDRHVFRNLEEEVGTRSLDEAAEQLFRQGFDLDWEEDVKPLLGNDIVIAVSGDPLGLTGAGDTRGFVAAIETRGNIRDVLAKTDFIPAEEVSGATLYGEDDGQDDNQVAVEDDVLIFA